MKVTITEDDVREALKKHLPLQVHAEQVLREVRVAALRREWKAADDEMGRLLDESASTTDPAGLDEIERRIHRLNIRARESFRRLLWEKAEREGRS